MVIQRETMFLINLIFTELFRCNITIKMFYKYLPIFYSVQHYIYVCVLTYSLVVSKRFFLYLLFLFGHLCRCFSNILRVLRNFKLDKLWAQIAFLSLFDTHNYFASSNDGILWPMHWHSLGSQQGGKQLVWYLNTVKWGLSEAYCLTTVRLDKYFVEPV